MANPITSFLWKSTLLSFGLFNYILFLLIGIRKGGLRKPDPREENEYLLARDKFWNLSKTVDGLHHRFYVLRNKLRLHYWTNISTASPSPRQSQTLVILLHGFPDSALLWRYILSSHHLREQSTLIAVDLPGSGGSDNFPNYGPGEFLEGLTEFIVAMREQHLSTETASMNKVFIVGHDWGCAVGFRLAVEAACLADRFIMSNAPYAPLALANTNRIVSSCKKMIRTFISSPAANYHCLAKILQTVKPLLIQIMLLGYMAAFQLPRPMVRWLSIGLNSSFVRGAHKMQYGRNRVGYNPAESMAISTGPGEGEYGTQTEGEEPQHYGESVLSRAQNPGAWFMNFTTYYRQGLAFGKWEKSIDTAAALHNIEVDRASSVASGLSPTKRRSSSTSSALFSDSFAHSLKAPVTILWGKQDQACTEAICLDGIGDYLTRDSQVMILPKTGHWTPFEKESRDLFQGVLERLVQRGDVDKEGLQDVARDLYPTAYVKIDKQGSKI